MRPRTDADGARMSADRGVRVGAGVVAQRRARRRGVALLAVLWVLAGAGTAATLALETARMGTVASLRRIEAVRDRWTAHGCLAEARARVERALRAGDDDAWLELPSGMGNDGCGLAAGAPAGSAVDVNTASVEDLARLPGFTPDVVAAVVEARAWGGRFADVDDLLARLPPEIADRLRAVYASLAGRLAFTPPGWVVAAGWDAGPPASFVLREHWVRSGTRVAVVAQELW